MGGCIASTSSRVERNCRDCAIGQCFLWTSMSLLEALLEPQMRMRHQVSNKSGSKCTQLRKHGQCAKRVLMWDVSLTETQGTRKIHVQLSKREPTTQWFEFKIVEKSSLTDTFTSLTRQKNNETLTHSAKVLQLERSNTLPTGLEDWSHYS